MIPHFATIAKSSLMEQIHGRLRLKRHSTRTEQAYVDWCGSEISVLLHRHYRGRVFVLHEEDQEFRRPNVTRIPRDCVNVGG